MLKILQAHLVRAFVGNLKIYAFYAVYPESVRDKNLAVRKVFAFSDSGFYTLAHFILYVCSYSILDKAGEVKVHERYDYITSEKRLKK